MIPDEAVERACVAYVETRFDLHHDIKPTDSEKVGMRAALEASGAVFLTNEEREKVLDAVKLMAALPNFVNDQPLLPVETRHLLESAREKLGK